MIDDLFIQAEALIRNPNVRGDTAHVSDFLCLLGARALEPGLSEEDRCKALDLVAALKAASDPVLGFLGGTASCGY